MLLLSIFTVCARADSLNPAVDQLDDSISRQIASDSAVAQADSTQSSVRPLVRLGNWVFGALVSCYEYLERKVGFAWKRLQAAFLRMTERRAKSGGLLRVPLSGSE